MTTPLDAFNDEAKRRMEHPFWGSFIISWLLINWKIIYVTLSWSSVRIDDKIEYIEELFPFNSIINILFSLGHLFAFPLITSFIAVWFIPILAREYLAKQVKNKKQDDIILRQNLKIEEANLKAETETTKTNTRLLKAQKEELEALKEKQKAEIEAEIEKRTQERLSEERKNSKNSELNIWDNEYKILVSKFP